MDYNEAIDLHFTIRRVAEAISMYPRNEEYRREFERLVKRFVGNGGAPESLSITFRNKSLGEWYSNLMLDIVQKRNSAEKKAIPDSGSEPPCGCGL